jgi:hypothetical protein
VGGIAGYMLSGGCESGYLKNSANYGSVTAKSEGYSYAGGIVGDTGENITIAYTLNKGNVSGYYAGGIVGRLGDCSSIKNSVAMNKEVYAKSKAGRIVADLNSRAANAYQNYALEDMRATGRAFNYNDDNHGISRSARQLGQQATYEGINWRFDQYGSWKMGEGYPVLNITPED